MQSPSYVSQVDLELDYTVDYARRDASRFSRRRRPSYSRSGRQPVMVNGIHRRRHKRISW
jgi:hypothetical protein